MTTRPDLRTLLHRIAAGIGLCADADLSELERLLEAALGVCLRTAGPSESARLGRAAQMGTHRHKGEVVGPGVPEGADQ